MSKLLQNMDASYTKYISVLKHTYKCLTVKKISKKEQGIVICDLPPNLEEDSEAVLEEVTFLLNRCEEDVFDNFKILSGVLLIPSFSAEEAYDVLMHFITSNTRIIKGDKKVFKYNLVRDHNFASMSKEEVEYLISSHRFKELVASILSATSRADLEMTPKEEAFIIELVTNMELFQIDFSKEFDAAASIVNHSKLEVREDIEEIVKCMEELEVDSDLIDKIRPLLEKEVKKNQAIKLKHQTAEKKQKTTSTPKTSIPKKPSKVYLTEKDVKALRNEVLTYIDIKHEKINQIPDYKTLMRLFENIRLLDEYPKKAIAAVLKDMITSSLSEDIRISSTYEEMIDVISILMYYKVEGSTIIDYITRENTKLTEAIEDEEAAYLANIDKINYLDPETGAILSEYYQMLSSIPSENASDIKELIAEETKRIINDNTYAYELDKAKERANRLLINKNN